MKKLNVIFLIFIFFIKLNCSTIFAQDAIDLDSQNEIESVKLNAINIRSAQLGVSLRSRAINLNYKQNLKRNIRFRASIRIPNISFSQINNRENAAFRNLGVALGIEKNIATSKFINIYGGGEISTNIDATSSIILASFSVHAIVGLATKISENIYAFGEVQPGLQLQGRDNFRDTFFRSSRAFNLGIMWNLNS